MDTRVCRVCHIEKPITEFYLHRKENGTRAYKCKVCSLADASAWHQKNIDKARAACTKWRKNNPKAHYAAKRAWEKSHSAEVSAMDARKRARRRNVTINDLTAEQFAEICQAFDFRCAYCPPTCQLCRNKTHKLTQDHVTATSKGGNHTLHNVVPACAKCNAGKKDRMAPVPVQPLLLTLASAKPLKRRKKRS